MLSTISTFLHDNNVVNCIIGGDLNTDLSRVRSGNAISLNNFISNESLSMVQQHVTNCIQYTFLGCNQSKSIIDHFIVSENIERYVQEYYTKESVDNLSDHVPLYMLLECTVVDVSPEQDVIVKENPIWNLAKEKDILEYQGKLNELLHQIDFSNDMKLCNKCNVMCLIKGRITDFHD